MSWKLATSALVLGTLFLGLQGCAADAATDPADDEEAATSEAELGANASKLVGAFHGDDNVRPPTVEGIVFEQSGSFFADVDTGIRCVRAPCPSHVRITGRFSATKNYLRLRPAAGEAAHEYHGRFQYILQGTKLVLMRDGWQQSFAKEGSYCAEPTDCGAQNLIHPMCMGQWACGAKVANTCSWKCGVIPTNPLWPSNATKLEARVSGGFMPPPPAGSTCQLSQQKFSLDIPTKTLSWEVCERTAAGPYAMTKGALEIAAADYTAVDAAMDALKVTTETICGADKPYMVLEVTSPAGTKTLLDSFYSCQGNGTYVDGIGGVFAALRDARN
jgi:hypothetical protein